MLLAADGVPNRQIAPMVGMNEHTVAQWRRRFETERLRAFKTASGRVARWSMTTISGCGSWPP